MEKRQPAESNRCTQLFSHMDFISTEHPVLHAIAKHPVLHAIVKHPVLYLHNSCDSGTCTHDFMILYHKMSVPLMFFHKIMNTCFHSWPSQWFNLLLFVIDSFHHITLEEN